MSVRILASWASGLSVVGLLARQRLVTMRLLGALGGRCRRQTPHRARRGLRCLAIRLRRRLRGACSRIDKRTPGRPRFRLWSA